MAPSKQDFSLKRSSGARSGSVLGFRAPVSSPPLRRSSAVLPSVLTFAVIVASGGLLLMIEKGLLNSVDTPPPRGNGKKSDYLSPSRHESSAADAESQVSK